MHIGFDKGAHDYTGVGADPGQNQYQQIVAQVVYIGFKNELRQSTTVEQHGNQQKYRETPTQPECTAA